MRSTTRIPEPLAAPKSTGFAAMISLLPKPYWMRLPHAMDYDVRRLKPPLTNCPCGRPQRVTPKNRTIVGGGASNRYLAEFGFVCRFDQSFSTPRSFPTGTETPR
jgi:hypothetical protein